MHARSVLFALALAAPVVSGPARAATESQPEPRIETIRPERPGPVDADLDFARRLSNAFAHAADRIEPAVVHITSAERTRQLRRDRFGRVLRGPEVEQQTGLGSGVIIDDLGHIVTNAHVVTYDPRTGNLADRLVVRLADGREYDAQLIGSDPASDLAVVRVEAEGLTAASWGDSEGASVGQWVLAVGSPFGFDQTVTAGIISSKARPPLSGNDRFNTDDMRFQEFIQTDAAINPGNSGGPLVDLEGRIVGINTAIASRSGGNNGLGFAIPADIARAVTDRIIETGRVDRGYIGVGWNIEHPEIDPELARTLAIPGGVRLDRVIEGGPGDEAGLETGDIIVRFGGRSTENANRLRNAIAIALPGAEVDVEYFRDGRRRDTTLRVIDRETGLMIAAQAREIPALGVYAGNRALEMTRNGRVIDTIRGAEVLRVTPGGAAERYGIEPGDVILEIDSRSIDGAEDLARSIDERDIERGVTVDLFRPSGNGRAGIRGTVEIRAED
ncbi:MAG: serine protease [Phycisphaeraceae bacterium]|nr:MAG: serine protease [Phycisphaeraceae bacterium]